MKTIESTLGTPSSLVSLSSDSDEDNIDKSAKSDFLCKSSSECSRRKKKASKKVEDETFIEKSDPKLKVRHHQCHGEPGQKPNERARATSKTRSEFSIEPMIRGDEIE